MRKVADDEPRLTGTQTMQILEHELAIVERTERIDDDDKVEGTGQRSHEFD